MARSVQVGHQRGPVRAARVRGERLELGQLVHSRPVVLGGCAQRPKYLPQLIVHVAAREQGSPRVRNLGEYASGRPRVDGGRVVLGAEEHVGRPVPQGDHFGAEAVDWDAEGAGQAEVGQLQLVVLVDQKVLRLEVAVENVLAVAEVQPLHQLVHERLSGLVRYGSPALVKVLLQVHLAVLEHQGHLPLSVQHVVQPHHVLVLQLLQDADFPEGGRRHSLVVVVQLHLLQRHDLAALVVLRLEHRAVRSLSDLLYLGVLVHFVLRLVGCKE